MGGAAANHLINYYGIYHRLHNLSSEILPIFASHVVSKVGIFQIRHVLKCVYVLDLLIRAYLRASAGAAVNLVCVSSLGTVAAHEKDSQYHQNKIKKAIKTEVSGKTLAITRAIRILKDLGRCHIACSPENEAQR